MAEYQRFIAYLYEYGQDGGKTGAGHLRVELRQGKCRMTVRIRARRAEGNCRLYFYIRKPGQMTGFPIGEVNINQGEAEVCFEGDASNLTGNGENFDSVSGVLIFGEPKGYLAADWNNQEVTPKEAAVVRNQPTAAPVEDSEKYSKEGTSEVSRREENVVPENQGAEEERQKQAEDTRGNVVPTWEKSPEAVAAVTVQEAGIPEEKPETGRLKQETEKEKAPEQVSDFWSAAKDIVKGLLNADQEIDPLDQITAVLRAGRQRSQHGSENLLEGAPDQDMQQKISGEVPGQVMKQKTAEEASDKVAEQRTAEVNGTAEIQTTSEETKQAFGRKEEVMQDPEARTESLRASEESEKSSDVQKQQAVSQQGQGKRIRRDSRRASGSAKNPAANQGTVYSPDMTDGEGKAKTENLQSPADDGIQDARTSKDMQKQDAGKEQQFAEKEQEFMEQVSLPPETSVYVAGMQEPAAGKETAAAAEQEYPGLGLHQTAVESLNAAARPYCGNRRLPWQDAPEAREILDTCVKMYPFQDGELAECVRIEPKDIGRLPMEYWHLGNNSFLLHGYCNYKYLLFAKRMNRIRCEYLLMIPGIFQQKEKMMARMFGFEQFKCARRREQRPGEFGYWYMTLIF